MEENFSKKVLEKLNSLLESANLPAVSENEITFVMEKDINFEKSTINSSKLIDLEKINDVVKPMVDTGPSWIHANLFLTDEKPRFISLRFGASVGNPSPEINASFEPGKKLEII